MNAFEMMKHIGFSNNDSGGLEPTSWDITIETTGASQAFIVTLVNPSSINIDWGDTSTNTYTTSGDKSHTYASAGTYIIKITGTLNTTGNIRFDNASTRTRLKTTGVPPNLGGMTSDAYLSTFYGCTGLTSIPSNFGRYNTGMTSSAYALTFFGCTGLTSIPADFGRYNTGITDNAYIFTFQNCTGLTSIPADFGRYNTGITDNAYTQTFYGCTGLTSIPATFGSYNTASITTSGFTNTFYGCTSLDGNAPALWTLYNDVTHGIACFRNCTGLDNYASIPTAWK